jgi:hypothetical protein
MVKRLLDGDLNSELTYNLGAKRAVPVAIRVVSPYEIRLLDSKAEKWFSCMPVGPIEASECRTQTPSSIHPVYGYDSSNPPQR